MCILKKKMYFIFICLYLYDFKVKLRSNISILPFLQFFYPLNGQNGHSETKAFFMVQNSRNCNYKNLLSDKK